MGRATAERLQDGRFLLLETLGRGGMASVYRAFDGVAQRMVALKVPSEDEPAGPSHAFATEFDVWSRLAHPNVVGAHELLQSRSGPLPRDAPYLVLEHVSGGPAHRMLRPGRERPETWSRFARDVLRGLAHIHGAGFLHRDLKPANILVGARNGERRSVKLTDFGLATRIGVADEPGCVSGSLPYLSPEALCGQPLDERADLYGLGILIFQLSTGRLPLRGASPDEWVRWHLGGPPLEDADCAPRLARFVRRLTARRREDRPADAAAAAALLGGVAGVEPAAGPQVPDAERARVRLAVDATRLGAVRVLRVGTAPDRPAAAVAEARVAAQVLGVDWYSLDNGAPGSGDLELVALALLNRLGTNPHGTFRRFGLERTLDLDFVGGHPILARERRHERIASCHDGPRLARFLLECASRNASAVAISQAAREGDPRVAALCRELQRAAERADRPRRGRGGLLALVP